MCFYLRLLISFMFYAFLDILLFFVSVTSVRRSTLQGRSKIFFVGTACQRFSLLRLALQYLLFRYFLGILVVFCFVFCLFFFYL